MIKGDFSKLRRIEATIRQLPTVVAQKVATKAASTITTLARATFDASESAYGDAWAPGADGRKVTLRRSGALAAGVFYVAIGTRLRARLGPRYAKYQVGKRPIFPRNGARLPVEYVTALSASANDVIRAELQGAG